MKKFLIEFIALYVAGVIIFSLVFAIPDETDVTAGDIFLYSLIMPALICGGLALGGAYNEDADDDESIFF